MELLSNPWVVGIGGGILSGLFVTLITRYLFSKRERSEYLQKVATANNEIIYAIRPAIAEKVIPSSNMLNALFSATARKYSVDPSDLFSRDGLANELIKEVMDNTFLSSQQKVEFCELLSSLKKDEEDDTNIQKIEIVRVTRESSTDTSFMLGITTAIMAATVTMVAYMKDSEGFASESILTKYIPLIAMMTLIPVMSILLKDMLKRVRRIRDMEIGETKSPSNKSSEEPNKSIQPTANASAD